MMSETVSEANQFNIPSRRDDSTSYNLQKLNQKHEEIIRLLAMGLKDWEIAEQCNVTTATVRYTKTSPVAQRKIELMKGRRDSSAVDIRKRIEAMAPLALDEYQKILEDKDASITNRRQVASDILDRAGHGAINKTLDVGKYTEERIEELKKRARENGLVVDADETEEAEYEEVDDEHSV